MAHDDFELDEAHPIPDLEVVDVHTVLKGGGSRAFVIIAAPLQDDRRSLERLMRKLERYMAFLKSGECVAECGNPTPGNTTIVVKLHPDSSAVAFDLLEQCKPWVAENDAALVIDTSGIVDREH